MDKQGNAAAQAHWVHNGEKTATGHAIEVADIHLNFRRVVLQDATPTGAQIAQAAGFNPRQSVTVLQFLRGGGYEDVRADETVELGKGTGRFLVVESDRSYKLTINGTRVDWPAMQVTGKLIRLLGGIAAEQFIYFERQDEADQLLVDGDVVDLKATGVEAFYSAAAVWTLNVQGVRIDWHEPTIAVHTAMEKAGFDTTQRWHIFLKVAGKPKEAVELNTVIDLRTPGIEKLRLTPKDVHNGEAAQAVNDFALLESDEAYLDRHYVHWKTVIDAQRRWLVIHAYPLPAGYSVRKATLALEIPPTYPGAQIDMFYVCPPLTLPGGAAPGATETRVDVQGSSFQRWSRHRGEGHQWTPAVDNVVTHLALVEAALAKEVSL